MQQTDGIRPTFTCAPTQRKRSSHERWLTAWPPMPNRNWRARRPSIRDLPSLPAISRSIADTGWRSGSTTRGRSRSIGPAASGRWCSICRRCGNSRSRVPMPNPCCNIAWRATCASWRRAKSLIRRCATSTAGWSMMERCSGSGRTTSAGSAAVSSADCGCDSRQRRWGSRPGCARRRTKCTTSRCKARRAGRSWRTSSGRRPRSPQSASWNGLGSRWEESVISKDLRSSSRAPATRANSDMKFSATQRTP